ncbi:hypothetical protein MMC10_001495 [Thelotrema lepadinum]|nr:hypothetical protein [Thelotrema lepadinum]
MDSEDTPRPGGAQNTSKLPKVVARCGHTLRPEDVLALRVGLGQERAEPVLVCATCDMLEIMSVLYIADLASERITISRMQEFDPLDALGDRMERIAVPITVDYVEAALGGPAAEVVSVLVDMRIHSEINMDLLDSKTKIFDMGLKAIEAWCEKWGSPWDLASVHVKYTESAVGGDLEVSVEIERTPGKECTALNGFWGLPAGSLGFPQIGHTQSPIVRLAQRQYGRPMFTRVDEADVA